MTPALLAAAALGCLGLSVLLRHSAKRSGPASPSHRAPRPAHAAARPGGAMGYLATHAWTRWALGGLAGLMVVGAAGALGYPFLTDQYTHRLQHRLEKQLVSGGTRVAYRTGTVAVGHSLTRIRIPKIGLDTVVVQGTTLSALQAGAGHYVNTPLPCSTGNVGIAGHRVTFGHPFNRLAELSVGDVIELDTPIGSCTYRVTTAPFPVDPSDVSVVGPTKDAELTLTTCHPEHSARQRLVLHATRVSVSQESAR